MSSKITIFFCSEHEEYGFCQVGTSSSFLEDDTLILGSPGPYTWRGTVFAQDVRDDMLERDNVVYMGPVEDKYSPVEKYSYLGKDLQFSRHEKNRLHTNMNTYYLIV